MFREDPKFSIAVIIPTYGNWDDCAECLGLLAEQDNLDFSVILANDGSVIPPPPSLLNQHSLTYLPLNHSGFASTCNIAAQKALSMGATHLLFLNDDTAFGKRFISSWQSIIALKPQAIMGPMIYQYEQPSKLWSSGGNRSILVPFLSFRKHYFKSTSVDLLTGCTLMVPRQAWIDLCGFDESYITYYEDFDLLLRAKKLKIQTFIQTQRDLYVYHKGARTAGRNGPWPREYRLIASRILFIRRHFSCMEQTLCLLITVLHLLVTLVIHFPEIPRIGFLRRAINEGFNVSPSKQFLHVRSMP